VIILVLGLVSRDPNENHCDVLKTNFCLLVRGSGPNGEAVLHTMYTDGACSRRWGDILSISKSAVDRELKRALEYKFGGPVPDPLDTVYHYWDEGAW